MKRALKMLFCVTLVLAVSCGVSLAVTSEGKIASVDEVTKMIKLERSNPENGMTENAIIWATDATAYAGKANGFTTVLIGDYAKIEVDRDDGSGKWMVKSIETSDAVPQEALPAAPSNEEKPVKV
ncbi:MAG TPA: hypothetical protein PKL97_08335 [Candidatus Omnitrophota bacterium]|nr:hypothetical protein [Candidatus Omnitrophota bacterium]